VDLLELWAGEEMPGDKPADQLAAWQQWYAQQWPDQPPATLPAYRVSGKWEFRELARYLTSGDGRYGSAERGAEVFQQAQCAGCHRRGATGDGAAPDLSTLPRRSMKKETLESILFPSHSLPERFAEQTVILGDGRILAGKLLPQEDSGQVLLVEATGRVLALEQAAIEEIVADHLSPMPEGLLDPFDLQQIADLFAYLHQTGEPRIAQQPQPTAVE
jgi:putative heme-binding domain-containing protein